jgi:hypothetical protein
MKSNEEQGEEGKTEGTRESERGEGREGGNR